MIRSKLAAVPPWAWIVLASVAGLGFLAWHRYANDDTDPDWTTPKETQPPTVAPFPVPGQHGSGSPMSCNPGFRQRSYPGCLVDASFSIIGDI